MTQGAPRHLPTSRRRTAPDNPHVPTIGAQVPGGFVLNASIHYRRSVASAALLVSVAIALAGCGNAEPTLSPSSRPAITPAPTPVPTATPRPTPQLVKTVTLVASVTEPKAATPGGLTWAGIQSVATRIGAKSSYVEIAPDADMAPALETAAAGDAAVVVTVGPEASVAVAGAAAAHPATQFLEIGVVLPEGAPANVHGLVFDEAQAGYLAGFVAAAYATTGKIGMVGDVAADATTVNYGAGFKAGAAQAGAATTVSILAAGSSNAPETGRTTAATLFKGGSTVILAMPSLTGIGAMRDACGRKAMLVAVESDAWLTVPDVKPCLITSVLARYDAAVSSAVQALAGAKTLPRLVIMDVASGGMSLSELHIAAPAGFQTKLDAVLATLAGAAHSTAP